MRASFSELFSFIQIKLESENNVRVVIRVRKDFFVIIFLGIKSNIKNNSL
jgi:hypothetical protein